MSWDHKGKYTRDEDESIESDPSRSVLERWHLVNLMRSAGMTHGFHRLSSLIAEVCPPGSYLKKSRGRLAEDSGTSPANVKRFFDWAYSEGLMKREKGRRGFSDRPWPDYLAWLTHAARAVARMTDQERREKEVERLVAFGVALGGDEAWERSFRESMQTSKRRLKLTPPRVSVTPPGIRLSPGVGSKHTPPQGQADPPEQVSNRALKQKGKRERENGPELEQAPLRASLPSSLSQDPEEQRAKSSARDKGGRDKNREAMRLRLESSHTLEGGIKPVEVYLAWYQKLEKDYPPEMIREVYEEVVRKINGGAHG